jgi:hypothetical protein
MVWRNAMDRMELFLLGITAVGAIFLTVAFTLWMMSPYK